MSVKNNPTIYFWAQLIGGMNFLAPVVSLFYLHRGLEYSDFFVMLLIVVISMFLFEVPTGSFADKYGPRRSILVGQSLVILTCILFIFANTRIEFYFISFLIGLLITFFSGCDEALIYDSLKQQKKEKLMSEIWGKILSARHLSYALTVIVGAFLARDLL